MPPLVNKFTKKPLKLGRKKPTNEQLSRAQKVSPFFGLTGATPPPPSVDYSAKAPKALATMLGNDSQGDCTIAALFHQVGAIRANAPGGSDGAAATAEALSAYATICGPGDQGCVITDVLQYAQQNGVVVAGTKTQLAGFVALDTTNQQLCQVCFFQFGGGHLGINLPQDWYENAAPGAVWDVSTANIIGGHSIAVVGYNAQGVQISTWGMVLTMTWAAFATVALVEEAYALVDNDWFGSDGADDYGLDSAALQAALAQIAAGGLPVFDPPTPTPPPSPGPTPTPTPTPTGGFTGTINPVAWTLTLSPVNSAEGSPVKQALARRGLSGLILSDVEQLVEDIASGQGVAVVLADVTAVLNDLFPAPASAKKK